MRPRPTAGSARGAGCHPAAPRRRFREAIAFLQRELDAALDVRDFAWSVPLGMEYKVYAISLSAIDLDTKSESEYLEQLAHGLRLPRDVRAQIHQRYAVPVPS